jgi:hypothetical protein
MWTYFNISPFNVCGEKDWNHFLLDNLWFMDVIVGSAGILVMVPQKLGHVYAGKRIWETLKCLPPQTLYI